MAKLIISLDNEENHLIFHPDVLHSFLTTNIKRENETETIRLGIKQEPQVSEEDGDENNFDLSNFSIVSLVGDPKSNKTFLVNSILSYLNSSATQFKDVKRETETLVLDSNQNPNVKAGVSIRKAPRQVHLSDGSWTNLFLLEPWTNSTELPEEEEVYIRLIDCLIYLSSVVIYADNGCRSKNGTKKFLWSPHCSKIMSDGNEDAISKPLFIVLQDLNAYDLYGQLYNSTSPRLKAMHNFAQLLSTKFQNSNTYRMPPCEKFQKDFEKRMTDFVQSIITAVQSVPTITMKGIIKQVLQSSVSFPLLKLKSTSVIKEEDHQIEIKKEEESQEMDMDFTSESTTTTMSAATTTAMSSNPTFYYSGEANQEVTVEKFPNLEQQQQKQEKFQIETEMSIHSDTDVQMTEPVENQDISEYTDDDDVDDENDSKILSNILQNVTIQVVNANFCIESSNEILHSAAEMLQKQLTEFHGYLLKKNGQDQSAWMEYEKKSYLNALKVCLQIVDCYKKNLQHLMSQFIQYLDNKEFQQTRDQAYKVTKDEIKANNESSNFSSGSSTSSTCLSGINFIDGYSFFNESKDLGIQSVNNQALKHNSRIRTMEEKMAKEARSFIKGKYHQFMTTYLSFSVPQKIQQQQASSSSQRQPDEKIPQIYTDLQITTAHKKACENSLDLYLKVPNFDYSKVWRIYNNKIQNEKPNLLKTYLDTNKLNIKKLESLRKRTMIEAEDKYVQHMKNFLVISKLTDQRMDFFHEKAHQRAYNYYVEKMKSKSENGIGPNPETSLWIKLLLEKITIHYKNFLQEKSTIMSSPPPLASSIDPDKNREQQFGIGIYFSPEKIVAGVFDKNTNTSDFYNQLSMEEKFVEYSPYITFLNDQILYGKEAEVSVSSSSSPCEWRVFNVYELLKTTFPDDLTLLQYSIKMFDEIWDIRAEEIIGIFLHNIRLELETKLKAPIFSCVAAISPFLSLNGKQLLKNALFLSGFSKSHLIQSLTAAAISHWLLHFQSNFHDDPSREDRFLFLHPATEIFDVSVILMSKTKIEVKFISGLPYLRIPQQPQQNNLYAPLRWSFRSQKLLSPEELQEKGLRNLILEGYHYKTVPKSTKQVILIQNKDTDEILKQKYLSIVHNAKLSRSPSVVDEIQGILLGACALNFRLVQNRPMNDNFPEYQEISPFTYYLQSESVFQQFDPSTQVIFEKNSICGSNDVPFQWNINQHGPNCQIKILEQSQEEMGMKVVSVYKLNVSAVNYYRKDGTPDSTKRFKTEYRGDTSKNENLKITLFFKLTQDGLFKLGATVESQRNSSSEIQLRDEMTMSSDEHLVAIERIIGIFPRPNKIMMLKNKEGETTEVENVSRTKKDNRTNKPSSCLSSTSSEHKEEHSGTSKDSEAPIKTENKLEEARNQLLNFIQETQQKMEIGEKTTNPLILNRVKQMLEESQLLLEKTNANAGSLQLQLAKLEKGAARIKC